MSRIGKQPIPVPAGVTIAIEPDRVTVNGPRGELSERIHRALAENDARNGQILADVVEALGRGRHWLHNTKGLPGKLISGSFLSARRGGIRTGWSVAYPPGHRAGPVAV